MRILRWVGCVLLMAVALGFGVLAFFLHKHQPLPEWQEQGSFDTSFAPTPANVRALFLGTSSLAWTDGEHTWLVDGFFSRQPIYEVMFKRLNVDETQVQAVAAEVFRRLDVPPLLSGVLVAHSHYDHSLDAPYLIKQYGGQLVGSESTWQIAKGQNMSMDRMLRVTDEGEARFGQFVIRLVRSAHAPTGFTGGFNQKPLPLPAHALQFKEGTSFSFVLSHTELGAAPFALVQPSAGFVPGQNKGVKVDTVFLGVGGLGKLPEQYAEAYWREMVIETGARRVFLIHWDDFTRPLMAGNKFPALLPMPVLLDDFPRSLEMLKMFSSRDGVELTVLNAWQMVYF